MVYYHKFNVLDITDSFFQTDCVNKSLTSRELQLVFMMFKSNEQKG